jgi:hypothetical protein
MDWLSAIAGDPCNPFRRYQEPPWPQPLGLIESAARKPADFSDSLPGAMEDTLGVT